MNKIEISVPDGISGNWRVESFTITAEDVKRNVRGLFRPMEYVPEGTYKRLMRGSTVVMSNTPMEVRTHWPIIRAATGKVLINGLGLGMVLNAVLEKPNIQEVTVVESSKDVIRLVASSFKDDQRVKIVHADAFTFRPDAGSRFNAVWHDIWDYVCSDNLEDMKTLSRRYGRRSEWQGSWCRGLCEYARGRKTI
jgi:spermidine synthase